jgi:hypothetical protein
MPYYRCLVLGDDISKAIECKPDFELSDDDKPRYFYTLMGKSPEYMISKADSATEAHKKSRDKFLIDLKAGFFS